MPAFTRLLAPDNSDNDAFRAWGSQISADLTSMGIPKTTDSGQINWATVTTPGGNGAVGGYEIRRFSDPLQSSAPVFFKIEYGGGNTTGSPGLFITVGTASDGSGNIAGVATTRKNFYSYNSGSSTPETCILSGDYNRCCLALFVSRDSSAFVFSIERSKGADGKDTGEGILYCMFTNSNYTTQFIPNAPPLPSANDRGIFMPTNNPRNSGLIGIDFALYPNYVFNGGKILNPGITHLGYYYNDISAKSTATINLYGIDRTYLFLSNVSYIRNVGRGGTNLTGLAILYE